MTRSLTAAATALIVLAASAACTHARADGAPGPAATAPPPPLPSTEPLPVVEGSPLAPARATGAPVLRAAFPAPLRGVKIAAAAGGTAYLITVDRRLHAVDLATGRERWAAHDPMGGVDATANERIVYATVESGDPFKPLYVGFSPADGRRLVTLDDGAGFIVGEILYAHGRLSVTAYDAATGRRYWRSRDAGAALGDRPDLVGPALLQDFFDSGATIVHSIYAFDVRDGHVLWTRQASAHPIGRGSGDDVYLETTPCLNMMSCFHSIDVDLIDVRTGASRQRLSYILDDITDGAPGEPMVAAYAPHVLRPYVYFGLHDRWYRYELEENPDRRHGVQWKDVRPRSWFDPASVALATHGDDLALARFSPDRVELQRIAGGGLRSAIVSAPDGTRYAVAGGDVIAVDPAAASARIVGTAGCRTVADLLVWGTRVAVRCSDPGERYLVFDDSRAMPSPQPAPSAAPVPVAPTPPPFDAAVHRYSDAVPERSDVRAMAPAPDGSLTFVMGQGIGPMKYYVARLTVAGAVSLTQIPETDDPIEPRSVAVDRHGTVWFNDERHATLTSLDGSGRFETHLIGEPRTNSPRSFSQEGIRVAIGPDGEAWFARSKPTAQIGRVGGGARYDVPPEIGSPRLLRLGSDGAFWFIARNRLARMTASGTFASVDIPTELPPDRFGIGSMTAGPNGTVWLAYNATMVQMTMRGAVRTVKLPNANGWVRGLVTGCDGSLYATELPPVIAHVGRTNAVEEYPVAGIFGATDLIRGSDCRIWVSGDGNGRPALFTFGLVPRR